MEKVILLFGISLFIFSCATTQPYWDKVGASQQDFEQDRYVCQQDAAIYEAAMRGSSQFDLDSREILLAGLFGRSAVVQDKRFRQCMGMRGWTLRQGQ